MLKKVAQLRWIHVITLNVLTYFPPKLNNFYKACLFVCLFVLFCFHSLHYVPPWTGPQVCDKTSVMATRYCHFCSSQGANGILISATFISLLGRNLTVIRWMMKLAISTLHFSIGFLKGAWSEYVHTDNILGPTVLFSLQNTYSCVIICTNEY